MGRAKKRKRPDTRGPLQRVLDDEQMANAQSVLAVITPEQRAKGTYQGERRIVNNHDPVMRWIASGKLSESQKLVIARCQRLWGLSGLRQALTANYGHVVGGMSSTEDRAHLEISAREDLERFQSYVPKPYWGVFERVCRWGDSAESSVTGYTGRSAQHRAHTIVCFVADIIASRENI